MTKKTGNKGCFLRLQWTDYSHSSFIGLKTAIFGKGGTFSRVLSDFWVKFCTSPHLGVRFCVQSTLKSLFRVYFGHQRNPRLRGVLKSFGHACLTGFGLSMQLGHVFVVSE